jgi:hypothetical protein
MKFIKTNELTVAASMLILTLLVITQSCRKESFFTGPDAVLEFSADTLRFDTVFTERGSATRFFKVYNPYNQSIAISSISIENTSGSFFRMNVDGIPGDTEREVIIAPRDSMYIFVEVTVNPDMPVSVSPFVVEDAIIFNTNGNVQRVILEAWGQNANYIPSRFAAGQQALLTCNLGEVVWGDPRPYVLYGAIFIDSCTLTIPEGTQIYVHGGVARTPDNIIYNDGILFTLPLGVLNIQGTPDNPVLIQSDRIESEFNTTKGQFAGIRIGKNSRGPHTIKYADFRHGIIGLYADSASVVNLEGCSFRYHSSVGLAGIRSTMKVDNCLFHDNDGGGFTMIYGGNYSINYSTFSNLNNSRDALSAQNFICYDPPFCSQGDVFPLDLKVVNSIITGGGRDAIGFSNAVQDNPAFFKYSFENCLVKVDQLLERPQFLDFFEKCEPCDILQREDPLFLDYRMADFRLDTMSVARDKGRFIPEIQTDIIGQMRKMVPDAGCYEFVE